MYNNDYENYMRSILGYPIQNEMNVFSNNNSYFPYRYDNMNYDNSQRYEELYPEIYKILKPMINKICEVHRSNEISEELLNNMTNEIYSNIEQDIDVVNVNIRTTQEAEKNVSSTRKDFKTYQNGRTDDNKRQTSFGNPTLRDLIRILIIQRLLENKNRPPRPPFPPKPHYRELENPSIYNNNYNQSESYPFYN